MFPFSCIADIYFVGGVFLFCIIFSNVTLVIYFWVDQSINEIQKKNFFNGRLIAFYFIESEGDIHTIRIRNSTFIDTHGKE